MMLPRKPDGGSSPASRRRNRDPSCPPPLSNRHALPIVSEIDGGLLICPPTAGSPVRLAGRRRAFPIDFARLAGLTAGALSPTSLGARTLAAFQRSEATHA